MGRDPFGVASLYKLLSHLVMDLTMVVSLSEREGCWLVSLGTLEILYVPTTLHLFGDHVISVRVWLRAGSPLNMLCIVISDPQRGPLG